MIRLNNEPENKSRQRHYNTWFRVMFIDLDGTFIGRVEKVDREFELYKVGEDIRLETDKVQRKYIQGEQWCYGDNITICECRSLCRNK
ncbi:hypothetical protein [Tenacibaculum finnmarkense]|uniref:hypothetical protein n=1 Tax=Tenacibaculum finnmarkense TaxID=2781243 RepID=UPI000C52D528|nr:hypothetical protein [Tenacibaculum finnmarkense]MCD8440964.1 hypothetical protein [Tenacibaculum finnmarkense genomovar ulcerans]MCG8721878.1 hypothetical protein [Tenacibaculum finnmarkense]SOS56443.1 hypothetical protein TFHFJT_890005 [Tenacibaculum finnmarkense]